MNAGVTNCLPGPGALNTRINTRIKQYRTTRTRQYRTTRIKQHRNARIKQYRNTRNSPMYTLPEDMLDLPWFDISFYVLGYVLTRE